MAMNVNQSGDSQGLWLTNEIITSNTQSLTYVRSGNKLRSYYNNKNIYNVALTPEELTKNYKIDKSRFNIVD